MSRNPPDSTLFKYSARAVTTSYGPNSSPSKQVAAMRDEGTIAKITMRRPREKKSRFTKVKQWLLKSEPTQATLTRAKKNYTKEKKDTEEKKQKENESVLAKSQQDVALEQPFTNLTLSKTSKSMSK